MTRLLHVFLNPRIATTTNCVSVGDNFKLFMNAIHLRYFVAVVETGQLRLAAEQLGVSQPALTKGIGRLENELGAPLFSRTARGMHATAFGSAFYARARPILARYRDTLSDMASIRRGDDAMIRVGTTTGTEGLVATTFLRCLTGQPRMRLENRVEFAETLPRMIESAEIDFALMPMLDVISPALVVDKVLEESTWLVARAGHVLHSLKRPLVLQDLQSCSWVLPSEVRPARAQLNLLFAQHGLLGPRVALETDYGNLDMVMQVAAGSDLIGICTNRARLTAARLGLKRLDVPGTELPRRLAVVCRADRSMSSAAYRFLQEIVDTAKHDQDSEALEDSVA